MKKLCIAVVATTVILLQSGLSSAAQKENSQVPSHAYLYLAQSSIETDPGYVEIVVQQLGNIRMLGCQNIDTKHLPNSPDGLSQLLEGCSVIKSGKVIGSGQSEGAGSFMWVRTFHQPKSDRFVFTRNYVIWNSANNLPGVIGMNEAMTVTVAFQASQKDSLNEVFTAVTSPDGVNPTIETKRTTEILGYDADIEYPFISEQPIED